MGNSLQTLSNDQTSKLTKLLTENFENYKNANMTDNEIQQHLTKDYGCFLSSLNNDKNLMKGDEFQNQSLDSKVKTGLSTNSKRGNTRRRSFDNKALSRGHVELSLPSFEAMSSSVPVIVVDSEITVPHIDSWESVDQQPYCNICCIAFKTPTFLARHVKYSDQHKMKLKSVSEDSLNASKEETVVEKLSDAVALSEVQIEGVDYKLLYGGSKFFWVTKEEIDFSIYLHCKSAVIEIIPFHMQKCKELNRIYLNFDLITKLFSNSREPQNQNSDNDTVRYILSRLQLSYSNTSTVIDPILITSSDEHKQESLLYHPHVEFGKSEYDSDDECLGAILKEIPMKHKPIVVTRRRSTGGDELAEVISVAHQNESHTFKESVDITVQEKI